MAKMRDVGASSGDMPSEETIGRRLRRLRLERGFSQRELSSPGVSYAYISRIEAGTRQPSVKALRKLAAKLGVSAEYLETGKDVRDVELRELRLADAELELRLSDDPQPAEAELRKLLEESLEAGDAASATRAQVGLGFAAAEQGRQAEAVQLLEEAIASGGVLPAARPDVYTTLGRAYAASGTPRRAVELFERCLADLEEQAPEDMASRVRFNTYLSYALTDMGEFERAEQVLTEPLAEAERLFGQHPAPEDLYGLRTEQAKRAAALGRGAEAVERAREALAALGDNDPGERGVAWLALGDGLRLEGDLAGAEDAYRRSADSFEHGGRPEDAAAAYRAWGRLLREAGREREALDVLEKAADAAVRPSAGARSEGGLSPRRG